VGHVADVRFDLARQRFLLHTARGVLENGRDEAGVAPTRHMGQLVCKQRDRRRAASRQPGTEQHIIAKRQRVC
jgi:hypothetical protein